MLVNASWRFLQVVHSDAYWSCWSFWHCGSMRGVMCTAPDGATVLLRSAKAATQHIKASTGEDVSEYFGKKTARGDGELLGLRLSLATEEDWQQQQPRGATEPEEEIPCPADGAIGLSNASGG